MSILALLTATTVRGEGLDSLQILVQRGDSCMQQYNTFEALKHYQRAFDIASKQGIVRFSMDNDFSHSRPYVPEDVVPRAIRLKLADCHYKRANYHLCAELLKNMSEDSLTHDAFRQLTYSYKHQGEGYYLTQHYEEAVAAWKEHLTYNPASIATYYNIANAYGLLLKDDKQAESYYRQFLDLARKEEKPNEQLQQMIQKAEDMLHWYDIKRK